jgi:hypothetical protein
MVQHASNTEFYSGQGVLMISERDAAGNPAGFRVVGNVPSVEIQNNLTTFEHKESITGQRAIDLRLTQENNVAVNITLESFDKENLALSMYGESTDVIAAVAAVFNTPVVILGGLYGLGKVRVSNVVVTDTATGLITYVDGDNYTLDENSGSIRVFTAAEQTAAGAADLIAAADLLTVTFDHEAQVKIDALTAPRPELYLRFEGLNTAKGNEPVVVEVFKFAPDPAAVIALLSDEVWQGELNGSALLDSTKAVGGGSLFYNIAKL